VTGFFSWRGVFVFGLNGHGFFCGRYVFCFSRSMKPFLRRRSAGFLA